VLRVSSAALLLSYYHLTSPGFPSIEKDVMGLAEVSTRDFDAVVAISKEFNGHGCLSV